jgi:hypothetical protein
MPSDRNFKENPMQQNEPNPPAKPAVSAFAQFAPKPITAPSFEHPSTPYSKEFWSKRFGASGDDFVTMVNPSENPVRALVYLGPPTKPITAPKPDDDEGDIDATPSAARRAYAAAYNRSLWTLIEFAPGASQEIPCELVGVLVRTDPTGSTVISGLAPMLRLASDPNPPCLHPALAEAQDASVDPFKMPSAPARGAKK